MARSVINKNFSIFELKDFLDSKVLEYNSHKFIQSDPIQIPHMFTNKRDIEISAFLTSTIAWGNRKSIINSACRMMEIMDHSPYEFVINHQKSDLEVFNGFVHRTFNSEDAKQFIRSLKYLYNNYGGIEEIFKKYSHDDCLQYSIHKFKMHFFEIDHIQRTEKHVSDPMRNSAAKRINMFLRWMVRPNDSGVDFGLWDTIPTSKLSCPLDVHSGKVARKLGLLKRSQNDQKAVKELDKSLRKLDINDPVKYDFALFGLGVFENF